MILTDSKRFGNIHLGVESFMPLYGTGLDMDPEHINYDVAAEDTLTLTQYFLHRKPNLDNSTSPSKS